MVHLSARIPIKKQATDNPVSASLFEKIDSPSDTSNNNSSKNNRESLIVTEKPDFEIDIEKDSLL